LDVRSDRRKKSVDGDDNVVKSGKSNGNKSDVEVVQVRAGNNYPYASFAGSLRKEDEISRVEMSNIIRAMASNLYFGSNRQGLASRYMGSYRGRGGKPYYNNRASYGYKPYSGRQYNSGYWNNGGYGSRYNDYRNYNNYSSGSDNNYQRNNYRYNGNGYGQRHYNDGGYFNQQQRGGYYGNKLPKGQDFY
jgi:hypothetical protein